MANEPISKIAKALRQPEGRQALALLDNPDQTVSDLAWQRVEEMAAEYMRHDRTLSKPRAIMKVNETGEGRELYEIMRRYSRQTIGAAIADARTVAKRQTAGFTTWGEAVDQLAKSFQSRDGSTYLDALKTVEREAPTAWAEWIRETRGAR